VTVLSKALCVHCMLSVGYRELPREQWDIKMVETTTWKPFGGHSVDVQAAKWACKILGQICEHPFRAARH
jgi:hypothetical protein